MIPTALLWAVIAGGSTGVLGAAITSPSTAPASQAETFVNNELESRAVDQSNAAVFTGFQLNPDTVYGFFDVQCKNVPLSSEVLKTGLGTYKDSAYHPVPPYARPFKHPGFSITGYTVYQFLYVIPASGIKPRYYVSFYQLKWHGNGDRPDQIFLDTVYWVNPFAVPKDVPHECQRAHAKRSIPEIGQSEVLSPTFAVDPVATYDFFRVQCLDVLFFARTLRAGVSKYAGSVFKPEVKYQRPLTRPHPPGYSAYQFMYVIPAQGRDPRYYVSFYHLVWGGKGDRPSQYVLDTVYYFNPFSKDPNNIPHECTKKSLEARASGPSALQPRRQSGFIFNKDIKREFEDWRCDSVVLLAEDLSNALATYAGSVTPPTGEFAHLKTPPYGITWQFTIPANISTPPYLVRFYENFRPDPQPHVTSYSSRFVYQLSRNPGDTTTTPCKIFPASLQARSSEEHLQVRDVGFHFDRTVYRESNTDWRCDSVVLTRDDLSKALETYSGSIHAPPTSPRLAPPGPPHSATWVFDIPAGLSTPPYAVVFYERISIAPVHPKVLRYILSSVYVKSGDPSNLQYTPCAIF